MSKPRLTVQIRKRNDQEEIVLPDLDFDVERFSNAAFGGPKQAKIHVRGDDLAIWGLASERVRSPIRIYAPEGDAVWWGYIAKMEAVARNPESQDPARVRSAVDVDSMFNAIAIAYVKIDTDT